ncbi:hypothetical protein WMY93_033067 [Mugilogobius chulae]|uniref:VWFA domain-containing protein n=1 Tax=Mugilogobius chulae TaxID=88201 RepID=A0AAW0MJ17_9GOBI
MASRRSLLLVQILVQVLVLTRPNQAQRTGERGLQVKQVSKVSPLDQVWTKSGPGLDLSDSLYTPTNVSQKSARPRTNPEPTQNQPRTTQTNLERRIKLIQVSKVILREFSRSFPEESSKSQMSLKQQLTALLIYQRTLRLFLLRRACSHAGLESQQPETQRSFRITNCHQNLHASVAFTGICLEFLQDHKLSPTLFSRLDLLTREAAQMFSTPSLAHMKLLRCSLAHVKLLRCSHTPSLAHMKLLRCSLAHMKLLRCSLAHEAVADLVFLVDGSWSIGATNFEQIRQFLSSLVSSFDVGPKRVRVGLVQYSNDPRTEFHLNTHSSRAEVLEAIARLPYLAERRLHRGRRSRANQNVPQIGVVITDGQSQDDVVLEARRLRERGIVLYAIGIKDADEKQLQEIAQQNVYSVSDFSALQDISLNIVQTLCTTVEEAKRQITQLSAGKPGLAGLRQTLCTTVEEAKRQIRQLSAGKPGQNQTLCTTVEEAKRQITQLSAGKPGLNRRLQDISLNIVQTLCTTMEEAKRQISSSLQTLCMTMEEAKRQITQLSAGKPGLNQSKPGLNRVRTRSEPGLNQIRTRSKRSKTVKEAPRHLTEHRPDAVHDDGGGQETDHPTICRHKRSKTSLNIVQTLCTTVEEAKRQITQLSAGKPGLNRVRTRSEPGLNQVNPVTTRSEPGLGRFKTRLNSVKEAQRHLALCTTVEEAKRQITQLSSECSMATIADIVFLIDGSSSIGPDSFEEMRGFLKSVVTGLDIGEDKVRRHERRQARRQARRQERGDKKRTEQERREEERCERLSEECGDRAGHRRGQGEETRKETC